MRAATSVGKIEHTYGLVEDTMQSRGLPFDEAAGGMTGQVELSAGTLDCEDTAGPGPVIVLLHAGKLPPALFGLFMQQMRLRPLRRLPIAFGWLTMRGDATTARWIKPVLEQREIRRDAVRMLRAAAPEPDLLLEAAHGLPGYD